MADAPILTESDIQRRVGAASFGRARPYVGTGALADLRRQGLTLRASCTGQAVDPYAVEVTLGMGGVAAADCSCPVGGGGRCKHVAALLLTWLRDAEAFAETEPFDKALARRSPADLAALVREMVRLHPDLEMLVTLPAGTGSVSARIVEREVRRIFKADPYEWGSAARAGRDLERLLRQATACVSVADWAGVVVICGAVIDGIFDHEEWLHDDSGALAEVVCDCVAPLGHVLARSADADVRRDAASLLYHVVRGDAALGGIGMGDEALPLLRVHAADAEKADLCRQIEGDLARMASANRWSRSWEQTQLGDLLLAFAPADLDDEAYLRIRRATGRTDDLVARLLDLGRLDEALAAARLADDAALVRLATLFVDRGHGAAVDALALERLGDGTDRRLVAWLMDRARTGGDAALALALAERLFRARPTAATYAEAVALGRTLGREDAVRDALRARLRTDRAFAVLAQACLHDGDVPEALRLVHRPEADWPRPGERARMRLEVAEAAAATHPEDALQLFLDAAVDLVERRGRENYAEAARLLHRVRALYRRESSLGSWSHFVGEIREAYRGLSAFQDELTKAGL